VIMLANVSSTVSCIGLGQSADGLGWIGSHKMDRWTTLMCRDGVMVSALGRRLKRSRVRLLVLCFQVAHMCLCHQAA